MKGLVVIHDGYNDVDARETTVPASAHRATGYGKNIPTPYEVFFKGRWRRVYATQYSNCATLHINYMGGRCTVL